MEPYDLVCLGCGPAGEKAATQAAYFGRRVAVVERDSRPGGAMVNTGTIPSKALRETALLCSSFRRRPVPGVTLEIDRTMTVDRFMAQCHLVQLEEHDRIESSFDRHGIEVVHGTGRIANPHTVEVVQDDGRVTQLAAAYILVATGSSPFRPDYIPFDHPQVVDADGILQIDSMPRSMAVVGGGVIGCEYACIFAEIGVAVTLIEPRDCVLPFIDDDCRDVLMQAMEDCGVTVKFGSTVDRVDTEESEHKPVTLTYSDGTHAEFDLLLWAAGRSGNTVGIGLDVVGIETNKRGCVVVDGDYRTSVPSIFAAGDVIGPPALTSTSMEQGRVAACHMFGIDFKKHVADTFPIGLYTIPPIAMVGLTEAQAREAGRAIIVGRAPYSKNARGRMYRLNEGLLKLIFDGQSHALIGAAMIGEHSTELIHIAQCAIAAGEDIEYFINACFNYPSISELYKYATYDALQSINDRDVSVKPVSPRSRASAA